MPQPPFSRRIAAPLLLVAACSFVPSSGSGQMVTDQQSQRRRRQQQRQQMQTDESPNLRPVIGIFAQQTSTITTTGPLAAYDLMVPSSYANWVGQAGARAIPVLLGRSKDYYREIFNRTNGLLLPGGSQGILPDDIYTEEGKLLWDMAKEANDNGDYYPIWGTCLGFEELSVLETGNGSVISLDVEATNIALPLNFTPEASSSRLFGSMVPDLVTALSKENITFNSHSHGLLLSEYDRNTALNSFFRVLSTNVATASGGEVFVSTMEAYNYPFYGVQWHPEKNNFEWSLKEGSYTNTPHSPNAVRASIETALFFNDYDNLLGNDLSAAGGGGGTAQFNAGEVSVWGLEFTSSYEIIALNGKLIIPLRLAYTYTGSKFHSTFESDYEPWAQVTMGDELPYLPSHQWHVSGGISKGPIQADVNYRHQSKVRITAGQEMISMVNGLEGQHVVDLSMSYRLNERATLQTHVRNLMNTRYAVAARPAGYRPGMPRMIEAGLRIEF